MLIRLFKVIIFHLFTDYYIELIGFFSTFHSFLGDFVLADSKILMLFIL